MKRKLSVAVLSCFMFLGFSFASAASAHPPHTLPIGGGGGGGAPPCTSYPCPIAP